MTGLVLDAAYPRWSIEQLKAWHAAGRIEGVIRYVGKTSNSKNITAHEYGELDDAGIPRALVYESSGADYVGGAPAGSYAGAVAREAAMVAGHPNTRPIFTTVDRGDHASPLLIAYQGAFNVHGSRAMYGDVELGESLFGAGLLTWFWQTNARAWPGDAHDDPRAALIQRTSKSFPELPAGSYDESNVFATDWGQWPIATPAPTPPPSSVISQFEEDGEVWNQVDVRVPKLDKDGNGHVELVAPLTPEAIATSRVKSLFHLAVRPPESAGKYDPIPRLSLTIAPDKHAEVAIEGGPPNGVCTFRVEYV